jgi:hypothetical protein
VHHDEIVLFPFVSLTVVDLVAAAFEDIERGLILMAVPAIGAAR